MVDNEANELPAPEGEGLGVGSVISCSAEFPNCFSLRPATVGSAAVSISIYNERKLIGLQILIFGPAELQIRQNSGRGNQPHLASPF